MVKGNFRIVPKFRGNLMDVGIDMPNGDARVIARVNFPNDGQHVDDIACAEEICVALKKRIRKSI